jgi:hypothetical protein
MTGRGASLLRIGAWLMFVAAWLNMLILLVRHWHAMTTDLHGDVSVLLVLLGATWGRLSSDKGRELDLMCLSLATATIMAIVHKLV